MNNEIPEYGLLVDACKAHGIARTTAYELASKGLLDTFKIGARRYVRLDSLRTLPARLAEAAATGGA